MTYKLAKKLKQAGFPQENWEKWREIGLIPKYEGEGKNEVLIPTLSELIEACGDGFFTLVRRFDDKSDDTYWFAYEGSEKGYGMPYLTPEDAVANLYLKLNK